MPNNFSTAAKRIQVSSPHCKLASSEVWVSSREHSSCVKIVTSGALDSICAKYLKLQQTENLPHASAQYPHSYNTVVEADMVVVNLSLSRNIDKAATATYVYRYILHGNPDVRCGYHTISFIHESHYELQDFAKYFSWKGLQLLAILRAVCGPPLRYWPMMRVAGFKPFVAAMSVMLHVPYWLQKGAGEIIGQIRHEWWFHTHCNRRESLSKQT